MGLLTRADVVPLSSVHQIYNIATLAIAILSVGGAIPAHVRFGARMLVGESYRRRQRRRPCRPRRSGRRSGARGARRGETWDAIALAL